MDKISMSQEFEGPGFDMANDINIALVKRVK